MIEFAKSDRIQQIPELVAELTRGVLYDEEPLFISDEATLLDLSGLSISGLQERVAAFYGVTPSLDDLREPVWSLLPRLSQHRNKL
jgi:hypothetical protein